jgi:phosphate transport system protein
MRESFRKQLKALHLELKHMGALCEDAISCAVKGLLNEDAELRSRTFDLEAEIDMQERDIEDICERLIIREQPVAGDLRQITTAQKIVTDMERIGDQAADIAELSEFMHGSAVKSDVHIGEMARATTKMLTDSVDSFVSRDLEKARMVIAYDDVVDKLFEKVKNELIARISASIACDAEMDANAEAVACLDLLMIAKYLERIGDHAENVAEWVVYSITGSRDNIKAPAKMT